MSEKIRIHIKAAGVNRIDLLQSLNKYEQPVSGIKGLEVAGITDDGQRVCALLSEGGYAEQVLADRELVLPLPSYLSFEEGAAIPEALFTAVEALCHRGDMRAGQRVLIGGALSGVGTIACQLVRHAGAHVTGLVGRADRLPTLKAMGFQGVYRHGEEQSDEAVQPMDCFASLAMTKEMFDLYLDMGAGAVLPAVLPHMAEDGRVVTIGLMDGAKSEIDMGLVLRRRLMIRAFTLRSLPLADKARIAQTIKRLDVLPVLRPHVHATYPLSQADAALSAMRAGGMVGKLVLSVG